MDVLTHHRKIRKLIVCDSIALFPDDHREEVSESSASQLRINSLLGISNEMFLKYNKAATPSSTGLSESQQKINQALGISPEQFKKYHS